MPDRRVIYDGLSRLTSPCTYAYSVKVLFHSRMECRLHAREKTTGFSVWRKRIDPARKVCKFEREANRTLRLLGLSIGRAARAYLPHPFPLVPTSLRPWPDRLPDRKLINECKRANVVDKFNKIVHAQLVSPGVNTFWRISSLSDVQESATSHPLH